MNSNQESSLRRRTWEILEVAKAGDSASRVADISLLILILLNVIAVVIESVDSINREWHQAFSIFEVASVLVFSIEYCLRVWSAVEDHHFKGWLSGRIKFALTPMALVDLVAILPFYLPFFGFDLRFVRVLRLVRVIRVLKVARYSRALRMFRRVFHEVREELVLSVFLMSMLLLIAATLMYYAEREVQPEAFASIPRALWWSVATLTTVGYGDVYPVTDIGKVLASLVALLGIGFVALPSGIFSAEFMEQLRRERGKETCPKCGYVHGQVVEEE